MAPPPTRRCAVGSGAQHLGLIGSSAHAEMRRSSTTSTTPTPRLLRPRGDAPRLRALVMTHPRAPPPTRRCALRLSRRARGTDGSSAHAEMRPRNADAVARDVRLLRPRGDAPTARSRFPSSSVAPPPTRRCARRGHAQRAAGGGSSAHAEMRRCDRSASTCLRRLLRPRGDAPRPSSSRPTREGAPPPTRRCALPGPHRQHVAAGSSAHAEMRPTSAATS